MLSMTLVAMLHFVVSLSLAAPQVAPVNPDDRFSDIYKRGLAKQRTIQSIRAQFVETTTSVLLTKPIVARGTIVAAAPAKVRMTYTEPEAKIMAMDGRSLVLDFPQRRERQRIDIRETQKRIDHYFTEASIDDLRKMFEIAAGPDPSAPHADRIDMQPKRKQIRQGLERLELWIDRNTDLMVQLRMTFPGGDQKTIALEDITTNVPVTDEMFQVLP